MVYNSNISSYEDLNIQDLKIVTTPHFEDNIDSFGPNEYVWSYEITMENKNRSIINIISTNLIILDNLGNQKTLKILPAAETNDSLVRLGEKYVYNGKVNLTTSYGIMYGFYIIRDLSLEKDLKITIPAFSLSIPNNKIYFIN